MLYISDASNPDEIAHDMQIMKMCDALKRYGVEVELVFSRNCGHVQVSLYLFCRD